jgi:hypothetical protein
MAGPTSTLYDLFWREFMTPGEVPVATSSKILLREPTLVPAVILYPALLTPAVHRRTREGLPSDRFQILMYAKDMDEAVFAQHVNLRLQVQLGLDPARPVSYQPLFDDPTGQIEVKKIVPEEPGGKHDQGKRVLKMSGGFRGILHPTVRLPKDECGPTPAFYQVSIAASCLERAASRAAPKDGERSPRGVTPVQDTQDRLVQATLWSLNGPRLKGQDGLGLHCFPVDGGNLDPTRADRKEPVRAYHPLFVQPTLSIGPANLGHVSDLHLNARQLVLARSNARVIDAAEGGGGGDALSKAIGSMVSVYSSNFSNVLNGLAGAGADLVLVGGDLVDHSRNCWPFFDREAVPASDDPLNPGKIWKLVNLDDDGNYEKNYQGFVDLLCFYSIVREFVATRKKPVFVVTGNHDAYQDAYGISPRVAGLARANEGIPADHNLTMYEAILLFGESFGTIKKSFNFTAKLFEWFFNVLTPFCDYAVELPEQRIVGLHWGEAEEMASAPFTGHGVAHLPRADEAATPAQVALAEDGFRSDKKTVLFSHFTFASFEETKQSLPEPARGHTGFGSVRFTDFDMGTFEQNRAPLYRMATSAAKMQAVFSGHSHRKGLHFLRPDGDGMAIEHYPIPMPQGPGFGAGRPCRRDATPIVVSDCGGPLPRINLANEFEAWGSDRPSGTLACVDLGGTVSEIMAVGAGRLATKPRLVVALEYLTVLEKWYRRGDAVFGTIETTGFRMDRRFEEPISLRFPLGRVFQRAPSLRLASVGLWAKPTVKGAWVGLTLPVLTSADGKAAVAEVPRDKDGRRDFLAWLLSFGAARFMSLVFKLNAEDEVKQPGLWAHLNGYDVTSPWNFEVDLAQGYSGFTGTKYEFHPRFEAPNFEWRREFQKYKG